MRRPAALAVCCALALAGGGHVRAQGNPRSLTIEGGVAFINPGSPVIADSEVDAHPIPRLPDGTVDLTGPWVGGGTVADIERDGGLKPGELPLLPWARQLRDRRQSQDDPYTACLPIGVLRTNPYPWKFAMSYTPKGLSHIYILHELGDAGAHRVVYMDGRPHPADPVPTWRGHAIGRWDGDTLVIDTVGFNDKFWFDRRGTPHTEQLHIIERYTRVNYGTLVNHATLDDPGALARPVNLQFTARLLRPDRQTGVGDLLEFICNEDNQYGAAGAFRPGTGAGLK
ncbi:MAG: hypothetical protein HYU37_14255 [Acidobacteria bacterium]|nr:hypothetical protein [Acidobacteriota bacterium]